MKTKKNSSRKNKSRKNKRGGTNSNQPPAKNTKPLIDYSTCVICKNPIAHLRNNWSINKMNNNYVLLCENKHRIHVSCGCNNEDILNDKCPECKTYINNWAHGKLNRKCDKARLTPEQKKMIAMGNGRLTMKELIKGLAK